MVRLNKFTTPELFLTETQQFSLEIDSNLDELSQILEQKAIKEEQSEIAKKIKSMIRTIACKVQSSCFKRSSLKQQIEKVSRKLDTSGYQFELELNIPDLLAVRLNEEEFYNQLSQVFISCLNQGAYFFRIGAKKVSKDQAQISVIHESGRQEILILCD